MTVDETTPRRIFLKYGLKGPRRMFLNYGMTGWFEATSRNGGWFKPDDSHFSKVYVGMGMVKLCQ